MKLTHHQEILVDLAYNDLQEIQRWWPVLMDARVDGLPGRTVTLSAEALQHMSDERQREERERIRRAWKTRSLAPVAPGTSRAPLPIAVVDTIDLVTEIVWQCREYTRAELAKLVNACAVPQQPADLPSKIPAAARWLQTQLDPAARIDQQLDHIASEARRAAGLILTTLGEEHRVHIIARPCPHCDLQSLEMDLDADPPLITCTSNRLAGMDVCFCSERHCECKTSGRPHTWPFARWDQLGITLNHAIREALR